MQLRSGKVITRNNREILLEGKTLIEFNNKVVGRQNKKKINGSKIRQIILESLKKSINIKFE
tara:strand:+ start:122 stop:307 length:186 start_codon:yes stop_codon:yes gene_type:complete